MDEVIKKEGDFIFPLKLVEYQDHNKILVLAILKSFKHLQ